jgi:hypothetical protein
MPGKFCPVFLALLEIIGLQTFEEGVDGREQSPARTTDYPEKSSLSNIWRCFQWDVDQYMNGKTAGGKVTTSLMVKRNLFTAKQRPKPKKNWIFYGNRYGIKLIFPKN